ncbi:MULTISPECIES: ABC transporter permease [unclassified Pseudonocardia]|uniref:ABC transporter permease n=1 Tax=unclassified Pseudonocardia TaxID=2619320 RepID=UPI0001FFDF04|nr:ABC transporter permease [Pseudonocardia sp. Ae707_Ps1]OLM19449.1 Dipeptide transport system permease protein DppB [Pseudonocardia sp. Ae707_Ps1]
MRFPDTDQAVAPVPDTSPGTGRWFDRHRWWVTRTAMLPVHVLVFAVVAFFLVSLIPGDPVVALTGGRLSAEDYAAARADLGLDGPWWERLGRFLGDLVSLDLGTSLATGRDVAGELATRLPATLELALLGLVGSTVATLVVSWFAVTRRGSWFSRVVVGYARSAGAIPEFVLAIAAVFVFYAALSWAPAPSGRTSPMVPAPDTVTGFTLLDALLTGNGEAFASLAGHLLLPVLVMIAAHSAILIKMLLVGLDEAIDAPATRFRIATGAPRRVVVLSVYRRAAPAMVATIGMLFGYLMGGAVVLESMFALGGLGQYAVDAVTTADVVALRSFLVVTAASCLVIYLVVDLVTMTLDVRRRPGAVTGE